jgi:ParB family chromosome partitioning protein
VGNLALASYGDIFPQIVSNDGGVQIKQMELSKLYPPEFHPFQVNDDAAMERLVQSVKRYGVREPGLVRKRNEGGYELLCGNRRKRACEIAEIRTMPVIVCDLDDDGAVIIMVDSNLAGRERILPSEKAWAYRVKMEALNHNGVKADKNSYEIMVEQTGESKNQIFRLLRLTELVPDLLDMVDLKQLAFNPAVELSYLSRKEQGLVTDGMAKYETKVSLSQAVRLKKLKQEGKLTAEEIDTILAEEKKPGSAENQLAKFKKYFPAGYTPKQIESVIVQLLKDWKPA